MVRFINSTQSFREKLCFEFVVVINRILIGKKNQQRGSWIIFHKRLSRCHVDRVLCSPQWFVRKISHCLGVPKLESASKPLGGLVQIQILGSSPRVPDSLGLVTKTLHF